MAGTKPIRIGSFAPGVDNRLERNQLESTNAQRQRLQAFAAAENIDVNDAGGIRRRRGYQIRTNAADAHSLWGDGGTDGYAVIGGDLVRLTPAGDALAVSLVRAGVGSAPVSFERHPDGRVLYTCASAIGAITLGADGALAPGALATEPTFSIEAGSLPAARYLVALTRLEAGIEGPAGQVVQLEVPANSAIRLVGLPGTPVRIYVSEPNGHEPLLQVTTSATAETIAVVATDGIRCQSLRLASLPAGELIRWHNGRIVVAMGRHLVWSEPYSPLYAPGESYLQMPEPITLVRPMTGGVYLATASTTFWLAADMTSRLRPLLPYGAIAGSDTLSVDRRTAYWLSPRGLLAGDDEGGVRNLQEDRLSLGDGTRGACLVRERNGATHVLTSRAGARPLINPADGFAAAELQRPKDFP